MVLMKVLLLLLSTHHYYHNYVLQTVFTKFSSDFNKYRLSLSDDDRNKFDSQWRFLMNTDTDNNTDNNNQDKRLCYNTNYASSLLCPELTTVLKETKTFVGFIIIIIIIIIIVNIIIIMIITITLLISLESMESSPPHIAGAMIMKNFMLDLLGRDSVEAKVSSTCSSSSL